jgi:REP element-mobilizing transposase RayT
LFKDDVDRIHFLDRLAEAQRRFRLSVYGYVLMDNHFHLLVCTPDANLSKAVQWLKVSYSMWFNAKYRRVGPLFQGRFKGILVDTNESWLLELSLYVHLNPVRVNTLRLGKKSKATEALGWSAPSSEVAMERLRALRAYRWSSYAYYAGYKRKIPDWLDCGVIRSMVESAADYRRMAEYRVTHGVDEGFLSKLKDRVALGSESYMDQIRTLCTSDREYEGRHMLDRRCCWTDIVRAVEQVKGSKWEEFAHVRGDWGRAASYFLARKHACMTLAEIGAAAGGVDYAAVSAMEKRFEKRLASEEPLKQGVTKVEEMLNIET